MSKRNTELSLTGTATLTLPAWVAEQDEFLQSADYSAQGATDGTKTMTLKNQTQNVLLTAALTISGVAALAKAVFVLASTNAPIKKGDVIVAVYTVSVAGAVAPGEVTISATVADPVAAGFGPAWAG